MYIMFTFPPSDWKHKQKNVVSYHKNKVLFEQNLIFWLKKVDFHQSGNETVKMEVLYMHMVDKYQYS